MTTEQLPVLFTINELAEYLGITPRTIMEWPSRGMGPKRIHVSGRTFFKASDIQEWLDAQEAK